MSPKAAVRFASVFSIPLVLALVAVSMLLGLLAASTPLVMLCVLLFLTMGGTNLWSRLSLARLETQLRLDKPRLFPGEVLVLSIEVANAKLLPVWLQVSVPVASALAPRGAALTQATALLAYQRATFDWPLEALRRGIHRLGPVELAAADPLGFFPKKRLARSIELVVYPRLIPLSSPAQQRRDLLGRRSARSPVEDPTQIQGIREYQPGRAARFIHWKASARLDRIVEKMCEPTQHEKLLVLLRADGFDKAGDGAVLERCLELVASICEQLDRRRVAFGFVTNARLVGGGAAALRIARHGSQLHHVLEVLARFEPAASSDMLELVRSTITLSRTVTVLAFDYALDAQSAALRAFFQQRRMAVATIVCQPDFEGPSGAEAAPRFSLYRLQDLHGEA